MHVQIDGDTGGRYNLHWRGVALGDFDGHVWSKPREQFVLQRWPDNSFAIPQLQEASLNSHIKPIAARQQIIHYRVLMEPIGTNVFFVAPWARSVSGGHRLVSAGARGR